MPASCRRDKDGAPCAPFSFGCRIFFSVSLCLRGGFELGQDANSAVVFAQVFDLNFHIALVEEALEFFSPFEQEH